MVAAMNRILLALARLRRLRRPPAPPRRPPLFGHRLRPGDRRGALSGPPSSSAALRGGERNARRGSTGSSVDVQGQTLRIRPDRGDWGGRPGADPGPVTIALTTRTLRSARTIGPASARRSRAPPGSTSNSWSKAAARSAPPASRRKISRSACSARARSTSPGRARLRGQFQGTGDVEATRLAAPERHDHRQHTGHVALTVTARPRSPPTAWATSPRRPPRLHPSGPGAAQVRCGAASDQRQNR